MVQVNQSRFIA